MTENLCNFPFCDSFFPLNGIQEVYAKAVKSCHDNPPEMITIILGNKDGTARYFIGWEGTPSYRSFLSWVSVLMNSYRIQVTLLSAEHERKSKE